MSETRSKNHFQPLIYVCLVSDTLDNKKTNHNEKSSKVRFGAKMFVFLRELDWFLDFSFRASGSKMQKTSFFH